MKRRRRIAQVEGREGLASSQLQAPVRRLWAMPVCVRVQQEIDTGRACVATSLRRKMASCAPSCVKVLSAGEERSYISPTSVRASTPVPERPQISAERCPGACNSQ